MNILEPGEVVVLNFDNIKELTRSVDGRIYFTNFRVNIIWHDYSIVTLSGL